MTSLGEEYPKEQARCRALLKEYQMIPTGVFGGILIEQVLREADEAAISNDVARMIRAYQAMKACE